MTFEGLNLILLYDFNLSQKIDFFFHTSLTNAIIEWCLGDLNDEWKEYNQNQISAYAVGSIDYYTNDLAHVHPGM